MPAESRFELGGYVYVYYLWYTRVGIVVGGLT